MARARVNRREFVGRSLAAAGIGAGFAIGGTKSSGRVLGANDAVRVAVAGLNGRGGAHVDAFGRMPDARIVYLVDPDSQTYGKRLKQLEGIATSNGSPPATVTDVRRALDDKDVDVVSVATPNHWHALITIWACQAGKDVYVEKPCSHNVHEGRIAVEAARHHKRVVQHGTQGRSSRGWAEAVAAIQSGELGKLLVSRALCYKRRDSIGIKDDGPAPKNLDFNIWLGPAAKRPYNPNYVHYNWHWFWDFGNGDIGNQGVHQMDIARWLIPAPSGAPAGASATFPKSVLSLGGRFGYHDQGQTANTQISVMDYGDTQLIFEVRGLKTPPFHGEHVGNIAHLEAGLLVENQFYPKGSKKPVPLSSVVKTRPAEARPGKGHFENFIAAVRSRDTTDLNADILQGHYSAALCHLANISYRVGKPAPFDRKTQAFGDDKAAYETIARMEEHLKENKVPLHGHDYQLGRKLIFDAATETFTNDAEANKLLTRAYRAPFTVPDKIA